MRALALRPLLGPLALLPLLLSPACNAVGGPQGKDFASFGGPGRIVDTRTGESVSVEEAVEVLAGYDVVFLGELHDNDAGHRLQTALTGGLLRARGSLVLSMEMFERDNQAVLDAYLAGEIDEDTFLADSRPWPNYREHYRAGVELARDAGAPVLAANVPRPLASRVVREGLEPVLLEAHAPRFVMTGPGEYRDRFDGLMDGHGGSEVGFDPDRVFAAQCIKDDAMAESIADHLANPGNDPDAVVVHWCGRFHSDYGLGTVERLAARMPHLRLAVVSMSAGRGRAPLDDDERASGLYVLRVP